MPATAPDGPVSVITTLVAVTGSLKVAATAVVAGTPVAPAAGARPVRVGAMVSVAVVSNTTSTQ